MWLLSHWTTSEVPWELLRNANSLSYSESEILVVESSLLGSKQELQLILMHIKA